MVTFLFLLNFNILPQIFTVTMKYLYIYKKYSYKNYFLKVDS